MKPKLTYCMELLALSAILALAPSAAYAEGGTFLLPENAATYGAKIDDLYYGVLYLTGGAFVAVLITLIYFCVRYRSRDGARAHYSHGNSWNALALSGSLALLVFLGIDMNVVRMSNAAAKELKNPPESADALHVQVLAQQFSWSFRYPGADGKFGPTDKKFMDSTNTFGVDRDHKDGEDDIISEGVLCVPFGKPIVLEMRSKDVIHSFFLVNFRVKQDVVPGMKTQIWFQSTRTGEFEIACAELCGMMHSQMSAILTVREEAQYKEWMTEKEKYQ